MGDLAWVFSGYGFSMVRMVFVLVLGHGRFLLQRNSLPVRMFRLLF
jgi:hypothetical protein